nr:MAG TPA: hypothetical protein [Caudoviricetes sp.]
MLIKEIKQALIGKTISYFDGWNGSCSYFKIGYLKKDSISVHVFPEKGKGWGVFIPIRIIPTLIEKGQYKASNEVERCSYETTWKLL